MAVIVSMDFETRSPVDLTVSGVHRYAEHPDTDIWCLAYCLSTNPEDVRIWRPGSPPPKALLDVLAHPPGRYYSAWNAAFESAIWRSIMVPRYHWPEIHPEQWICRMAAAASASLPLSLASAAQAVGLEEGKDLEGRRLMLKMSRPRDFKDGKYQWWDSEANLARLGEYCKRDVQTEMRVSQRLPPSMTARERAIWLLDQRINNRGVRVDTPAVHSAIALAEAAQADLDREVGELTGGLRVTQVAQLRDWVAQQGVPAPALDKAHVAALLETPLPENVRRVLLARQEGAKSSVAKYQAFRDSVCADERIRGAMQYYGATTGRWAGRGVQPHNLPVPSVIRKDREIEAAVADLGEHPQAFAVLHGPVLPALADLLRNMFVASPGKKLAVADYSSIEARVVAWLAGQADLLELFASGGKVYEELGALVHGITVAEMLEYRRETGHHHPARQDGKIGILGCGFQMGALRMSEQYNMPLERAERIVKAFRDRYPAIVQLWRSMNDAAIRATREGERGGEAEVEVGHLGHLRFIREGQSLRLVLPSGRSLWYHAPKVVSSQIQRIAKREIPSSEWIAQSGEEWAESYRTDEAGIEWVTVASEQSFETTNVEVTVLNNLTRRFQRQKMHGGLWAENAVQAVARDILAEALLRCESRGFEVVLTVHDEIVAEVPLEVTAEDFVATLEARPTWAGDCPIAAEGWTGKRYRK